MRRRSIWEQLRESTEGPTVTLQIPRETAEQFLNLLAASLDMGDVGDGDPADDEFGDIPDGDEDDGFNASDDSDGSGFSANPAGDSFDVDSDEDEDNDEDDDDEDDDEDEKDEAADYSKSGGNASGLRTQTALGERRRRR